MKNSKINLGFGSIMSLVGLIAGLSSHAQAAAETKNYFPSFADEHTVGLWLFDETQYPFTTLTDASLNEYDLRLMKGAQLVSGKFGTCLKTTPGLDYNISFAGWKGAVGFNHMRENSGRPGSGLFAPTIAPEQIARTFAERDWTCEFWLLLMSSPPQDSVIIDLGDKLDPGFSVTVKSAEKGFVIENAYAGLKAECPTSSAQIGGRAWHHIAFTHTAGSDVINYFINGKSQPPQKITRMAKSAVPVVVRPESISHTTPAPAFKKERRDSEPDYEGRIRNRFNFALGQDRQGGKDLDGNIDELRFSDVIRYSGDFDLPGSFSRNHRKGAPKPSVPNGPPLLFGADKAYRPGEAVQLGSSKHVFIDEVMVDRKEYVKLTVNPPSEAVPINEPVAWDASFFDHEGKIYTVVSEGYEGTEGPIHLLVSDDGIHFTKPNLGLIEHHGSKDNNLIMIGLPSWGKYFKDPNPACPPEERFKATLWVGQRGIYLYFSPDAIHWRRNETCMLPLVSGGGCETFWDDQQGMYFNCLKRDGSYGTGEFQAYGRSSAMFRTREVNKTWPFAPVTNPYFEGWPFPAVTGEGITVLGPELMDPDRGQVFRTRPQKYDWAPDTYVAFPFRARTGDMAISRDALNWKYCAELGLGNYLDQVRTTAGQAIRVENGGDQAGIANGMIRRGDKIWQYIGGRSASKKPQTFRVTQRLDGLLSLDAGEQGGVVITRPLVFEGRKLVLNVAAKGQIKVAIVNTAGREIGGYGIADTNPSDKYATSFGLKDCDPIKTDSVSQVVTWKGNSDVSKLAGQVVRLRFEMQDAKLFAFQFE